MSDDKLSELSVKALKVLAEHLQVKADAKAKIILKELGKKPYIDVLSKKAEYDVLNGLLKDCNRIITEKESLSNGSSV